MNEQIDFTNCDPILGRAYNGANGKKIAVMYDDVQYMLKFPPSGAAKSTELSYTNSCISEHIGSSIFNLIGIDAQKTMLGTFTVGAKTKMVCACRDFTADGKRFFDFCSIKNTILESESGGNGTELEDILDTIEKQKYISPASLTEHFWNMFVMDAFLGNFDRHNGNWGFLFDDTTGKAVIAPIFDCGSCLLPQADEKVMEDVLINENAMNARIFQFPTSAIKRNGRKINYYDFLTSGEYKDCNDAVGRIVTEMKDMLVQRILSNWQLDLPIFPIVWLPKPRRSHRYACVCEAALSEKYAASNYPKLNIRCTRSAEEGKKICSMIRSLYFMAVSCIL